MIERFHRLHEAGCFVIPNPWDVGSARLLERLGFPALATTSSGYAWTTGRSDGQTPISDLLAYMRAVAAAVGVPVSADFLDGLAPDPEGVGRNIEAACTTGIAGVSIEDSWPDGAAPLYDFERAVDRVRAARAAIDGTGTRVLLTARSEGFIVGRPDLDETIRRLTAFSEAGADCLYAPGLRKLDDIGAVVRAVAPKPVNVLVGSDFTAVATLAEIGVRRISVGGALARVAWGAFLEAAREIAESGTFTAFARAVPFADIDGAFARGPGDPSR